MGYEEASAYLDDLGVDAMKKLAPSTHRIEAICALLDHPERVVPAIHITGTNGKSSTARIASSVLTATGLSVGTYTSPHLQTVRERISLAGEPISEHDFGQVFDHIKPYIEVVEKDLDDRLSYFEVLTAMFFLWASETVDAIVVEVGMGGRWDATNVLPSSVPVVTNISLDHTELLGKDRLTIAREKSGIVKPDSVLVTAERAPDVLEVLGRAAITQGSTVSSIGKDFELLDNRVALGGRYLSVVTGGGTHEGLFLPLHGAHQAVNAATALEAVARFLPAQPLSHEVILEGLGAVTAPGRLETAHIEGSSVPVVLDVAHNPDGTSSMVTSLLEAFAFDRVVYVIGILADKDYEAILAELARTEAFIVATRAASPRAIAPDDLLEVASGLGMSGTVVQSVPAALDEAIEIASENDLICVTGSHYVVGEAREVLLPSKRSPTTNGKR